jgi:hypothetical protein
MKKKKGKCQKKNRDKEILRFWWDIEDKYTSRIGTLNSNTREFLISEKTC